MMIEKGYYLPDIRSRIITTDYLVKVSKGINFGIKSDQIKSHLLVPKDRFVCKDLTANASVFELIEEINKIIVQSGYLRLGITHEKPANKAWLTNVLSTLKPYQEFFSQVASQENYSLTEN